MKAFPLFFVSALSVLLLTGCVEENAETMEDRRPARDIIARRTCCKITIDGILNEPAWEKAAAVEGFFTIIDGKSVPAQSLTRVRVLWDDEHLYIGAEMEDEDLIAFHTVENSRTWEDDVFEVFIKPLEERHGYYEFHVTPKNTTLQLYMPRRGLKGCFKNYIFQGGMKTAVSVRGKINDRKSRDEGWTAEIAIPFTAFAKTAPPPEDGTVWTAAFCRYDYSYYLPDSYLSARELSSSAALTVLNFHRFEDYDRLIFTED